MKKLVSLSRRDFIACAFAAVGSAALAGCGSSSSSSSTDASDASSGSDSYTLVKAGTLTVASDLANPPLDYVDTDTNEPAGFEVELMQAIGEKLGLTSEYLSPMKFDTIIPTVKQGGTADVGVSNFTITDERKEEIDFTDPYLDSNQGLVTKADYDFEDQEQLNSEDIKIAAQSGTTGESWVQENLPNATLVSLDDPVVALTGVSSGLYVAAVADLPVMQYLVNNSYTDCKVALEIPTGEQYGIVVSKDNPNLTAAINDALAELDSDGTLSSLKEKWFGADI
ncbi:MAG: ABC transporter substrate-binding protein [Tractidigestivibacter sp.]|jgi:ABC-type amino acid transport substrate-binding protein|uniref:ABC transporter substrate-binding protein n=1 Tax=Tractidigestivibacter sp. TaxID=2847320 RepID=UPI003D8F5AEC